jgi:hypothetical protein
MHTNISAFNMNMYLAQSYKNEFGVGGRHVLGVDKKLFTLKLVMLSFLSLQFAAQMASGLLSVPRFVMCI